MANWQNKKKKIKKKANNTFMTNVDNDFWDINRKATCYHGVIFSSSVF